MEQTLELGKVISAPVVEAPVQDNKPGVTFDGHNIRPEVHRRWIENTRPFSTFLKDDIFERYDYYPQNIPNQWRALYPCHVYPSCATSIATRLMVGRNDKSSPGPFTCIDFTRDGRRLTVASKRGKITLWQSYGFNFYEAFEQHHGKEITALTWSYSGDYLLSVDIDNKVNIWQSVFAIVDSFQCHTKKVHQISFSPTDRKFCTCSDDNLVNIWDLQTRTLESSMEEHGSEVHSCVWHPSRSLIASAEKNMAIIFSDPRDSQRLSRISIHKKPINRIDWNPNGLYLLSASADNTLKVVDIRTMSPLQTFSGHEREVTTCKWHPTQPDLFVSGGKFGELLWWALGVNEPIYRIMKAHIMPVNDLAFHPTNGVLVSAGMDGVFKFWSRSSIGTDCSKSSNEETNIIAQVFGSPDQVKKNDNIPGLTHYNPLHGKEDIEQEVVKHRRNIDMMDNFDDDY